MIVFESKSWQLETGVREDLRRFFFFFMSEEKVHMKVAES